MSLVFLKQNGRENFKKNQKCESGARTHQKRPVMEERDHKQTNKQIPVDKYLRSFKMLKFLVGFLVAR